MKKFTKVKIIQCSSEKYWYSDKIGKEYTVVETSVRDYYVSDNGTVKGILILDLEVIN